MAFTETRVARMNAGVSSIGALDFRLDEWRVDVAVTGSQKALSLPTGLAVMAASPKVVNLLQSINCGSEVIAAFQRVFSRFWG